MKDGWIQNDERRVLMDDRLLGHRAFTDLSFTQKNILTIQLRPGTLLYFISVPKRWLGGQIPVLLCTTLYCIRPTTDGNGVTNYLLIGIFFILDVTF